MESEETDKIICNNVELPINVQEFKKITEGMVDLFRRKNTDYGDSFANSCDEEGIVAARIRLGDKWSRFKKLSRSPVQLVNDESIEDTLLDMASYCIMTTMWLRNNKK